MKNEKLRTNHNMVGNFTLEKPNGFTLTFVGSSQLKQRGCG